MFTQDDRAAITAAAQQLASAIERRDVDGVANFLAPDFVLRTPGGAAVSRPDFLSSIGQLPEGIEFVRLLALEIDLAGDHALVTGVQHACVLIDGQRFEEHKPFVDWFVRDRGEPWRVRAALELPALAPA